MQRILARLVRHVALGIGFVTVLSVAVPAGSVYASGNANAPDGLICTNCGGTSTTYGLNIYPGSNTLTVFPSGSVITGNYSFYWEQHIYENDTSSVTFETTAVYGGSYSGSGLGTWGPYWAINDVNVTSKESIYAYCMPLTSGSYSASINYTVPANPNAPPYSQQQVFGNTSTSQSDCPSDAGGTYSAMVYTVFYPQP